MRAGDVLLLKFTDEYLLANEAQGETPKEKDYTRVRRWIDELLRLVPEGIVVVVFDQPSLENVYPEGLSVHVRRSGLFEDALDELMTPQERQRLERINRDNGVMAQDVSVVKNQHLMFQVGGRLSVFRKRSTTPVPRALIVLHAGEGLPDVLGRFIAPEALDGQLPLPLLSAQVHPGCILHHRQALV